MVGMEKENMNEDDLYIRQYKGTRRNHTTYKLCVPDHMRSNKKWNRHRHHSFRNELRSYTRYDNYEARPVPDSKSGTPACDLNTSPKDRIKNNVQFLKHHELYPSCPSNMHTATSYCPRKGFVRYPNTLQGWKHGKQVLFRNQSITRKWMIIAIHHRNITETLPAYPILPSVSCEQHKNL